METDLHCVLLLENYTKNVSSNISMEWKDKYIQRYRKNTTSLSTQSLFFFTFRLAVA
jgi:hypothetical protein